MADQQSQTTAKCPKRGYLSGNDWSQCGKSCPMPSSPHYRPSVFPANALREAERQQRLATGDAANAR